MRMMDATLGRLAQCLGHVQRPDRQVTIHSEHGLKETGTKPRQDHSGFERGLSLA